MAKLVLSLPKGKCQPTKQEKRKVELACERLWKECVRLTAGGICEYPGCKSEYLVNQMHHHHFFNRKNKSTIWWVPNGIYLCAYHHKLGPQAAHEDPFFKDVFVPVRGEAWLDELLQRRNQYFKYDYNGLLWYKQYLLVYRQEIQRVKGVIPRHEEAEAEREAEQGHHEERPEEEGHCMADRSASLHSLTLPRGEL